MAIWEEQKQKKSFFRTLFRQVRVFLFALMLPARLLFSLTRFTIKIIFDICADIADIFFGLLSHISKTFHTLWHTPFRFIKNGLRVLFSQKRTTDFSLQKSQPYLYALPQKKSGYDMFKKEIHFFSFFDAPFAHPTQWFIKKNPLYKKSDIFHFHTHEFPTFRAGSHFSWDIKRSLIPHIAISLASALHGIASALIRSVSEDISGIFSVACGKTSHALRVSSKASISLLLLLEKILFSRVDIPSPALPKISFPKMRFPILKFPLITLPAIRLPHLTLPKLKIPSFSFPRLTSPLLILPKFLSHHISLPRIKIPTLRFPSFSFPKVSLPKPLLPKLPVWIFSPIKFPSFSLPKITLQKFPILQKEFSLPKISFPKTKLPLWKFPRVTLPKPVLPPVFFSPVKFPRFTLRAHTLPRMTLPQFLTFPFSIRALQKFLLPKHHSFKLIGYRLPNIPRIHLPVLHLPAIPFPPLKLPNIKLPSLVFPIFTLPRIAVPKFSKWKNGDAHAQDFFLRSERILSAYFKKSSEWYKGQPSKFLPTKHSAAPLLFLLLIAGTVGIFFSTFASTTNRTKPITYQGRLMDTNYVPVADTTYQMKFIIYDASSDGTCKWATGTGTNSANCTTPSAVTTTVSRGFFSIDLGNGTTEGNKAFPYDFTDATTYLEIRIGSETLTPRHRLSAAPYALNSEELGGVASSSFARLTGQSGGQTLIGGLAAADSLTLQGTASSGTTATNAGISLKVGDAGATTAMTILNNGKVGIGTATPSYILDILTSTASDRGINITNTATSGTKYGMYASLTAESISPTSVGGYFAVRDSTTTRGLEVANLTSTDSTGLTIGTIAAATSSIGVKIGALSGAGTATGIDIGAFSNTGSTQYGITIGAFSGTHNSGTTAAVNVGNISSDGSSTNNYGILLGTLTGGTTANYQISTGILTSATTVTNAQLNLGGIVTSGGTTNYGINIGALSGSGTTNYGMNITAMTSVGTTNYGLKIGALTGAATTNYGLYIDSVSGATSNYGLIVAGGNVGIGTTTPSSLITAVNTTMSTANYELLDLTGTITTSSGGMPEVAGQTITITNTPTVNVNKAYGSKISLTNTANLGSTLYGQYAEILDTSGLTSGTITAYGGYFKTSLTGLGNGSANAYGVYADAHAQSTETGGTYNIYGVYIKNNANNGSGTVNHYGLYVEEPTGGDANYSGIFAGGNVGIGTTTPATLLQLGTTGSILGVLSLAGSTSGLVTIQPAATAGTWTLTLPANDGDSGQYLQTNGSGTTSWATATNLTVKSSTNFETSARFSTTATNGTATFGTPGVALATTGTQTSYVKVVWEINSATTTQIFAGSPLFTARIAWKAAGAATTSSAFIGLGQPTVDGTGHTSTTAHIGFFIISANGNDATLYASQADGTTLNRSTALTTLTTGSPSDVLDLIFKVNGSTSVDYYYRKNVNSLSSATNLTSNMPALTTGQNAIQFSASNDSTANSNAQFDVGSASYER